MWDVRSQQRFKGYNTDPQGHPDIEQSKYVQFYVKKFQQYQKYLSLCLLAIERFLLDLLAQVHGHVGGFPSGGETVMNLVPLCHSMDMVCCQRQALSDLKEQYQHGLGPSRSLSKVTFQIFIQLVTCATLETILLLWWDNAC